MVYRFITICLVLLLTASVVAEPPLRSSGGKGDRTVKSASLDTETWIDVNNLLMFVTNIGNFAHQNGNTFGISDGLYFPFSSVDDIESGVNDKTVIFSAGLWIGAQDKSVVPPETLTVISEFSHEYFPGPMIGGTFDPDGVSKPEYKVYKINRSDVTEYINTSSNAVVEDYLTNAVPQGAPTRDEGGVTIPDFKGDQWLWTVYNDANPEFKTNTSSATDPLGLEVEQEVFGFDRADELGQIYFMRYVIHNKGGRNLDSMFISLWADPDLGGASDDLVGSDTLLSLGYCYNATNNDEEYGSAPPAVGFDFFRGPLEFTGILSDTAFLFGDTFPEYINLGMTSFQKYINGQEPQNNKDTYEFMTGLDGTGPGAQPLANGTKFYAPGDPVTKIGDLDFAPDDRRWMMTTGPINFADGDSTEIWAAVVVAQGVDRLSSITALRWFDTFAQEAFDNNFVVAQPPATPIVSIEELDQQVVIQWTDTSEVDSGSYAFEGYTLFQLPALGAPQSQWRSIINFDVVNDITQIVETDFDVNAGLPLQRPTKRGSDNGIQRWFAVTDDLIGGGTLNNGTSYFFRLEAYTVLVETDTLTGEPVFTTLTSQREFRATPQQPPGGEVIPFTYSDTLDVTHTWATDPPSDGVVAPFVVNPALLSGHTYRVTFQDTVFAETLIVPDPIFVDSTDTNIIGFNSVWDLFNVTTNTLVIDDEKDQSGGFLFLQDLLADGQEGFLLNVQGPPTPGVKPLDQFDTDDESQWGWSIPQGTRRWTWAQADGFHFEGFRGAIGWAGPAELFGSNNSRTPITNLVAVELRLATADTDGVFDQTGGDENVSFAYRYGRGFTAPPAQPEFAPFIVNAVGGYSFQEFDRTVPLSAWDITSDPPRRLAVAYLENNAEFAVLDGKYWPRDFNFFETDSAAAENGANNTSSNGPREWLFILDADYSEISNPAFEGEFLDDSIPVLYWCTVNRRGDVPYSPGGTGEDRVRIFPAIINSSSDTFTFVAQEPFNLASGNESALERIKAVPNPYYLASTYDNGVLNRRLKFTNLPTDATVRIFTLAGDLVNTIPRNNPANSFEEWDLETREGIPVASGVYIYVVESPRYGTKIGKVAVFIEQEQLGTY